MPILKVGIITRKTRHYKDGKFSNRPEGTGFYDNRNRKRVPEKIKSLINMSTFNKIPECGQEFFLSGKGYTIVVDAIINGEVKHHVKDGKSSMMSCSTDKWLGYIKNGKLKYIEK